MRIVVTGREGQVVTALRERAPVGVDVIALGRPLLDLADLATIGPAITGARPDVVLSVAAYTAVDKAESEPDLAMAINAHGPGEVARMAHDLGVPLIHLSTDYVFDGTKPAPYVESDSIAPLGVYGRTKLAGEQAVLAAHDGAVVCRTAWVYSPFGQNFVKTMLRLATTRDEVGVVADQIGNPTSALDIADALLAMSDMLVRQPEKAERGIFHLTGKGEGAWADLAETIFAASAAAGGPSASVRRIATTEYPTPAPRPANSRLDCNRLAQAYHISLPAWTASVAGVVERLVNDAQVSR